MLCLWLPGKAAQTDTIFSAQEFLALVKSYHPLVRKTGIQVDQAAMNLLFAKGLFDPALNAANSNKTLDGLQYYQSSEAELVIPTWFGVEFKSGIEYLQGNRINTSETSGTLSYAGVQIPILKNLVYDKRRAALQQAKQAQFMAYEEQKLVLNQLIMDAMYAYFDWVQAWELLQLADKNYSLNMNRMKLVVKSFELGERAAIDTLEAYTLVQQFELLRNQHYLEFVREGIYLSAYLWNEQTEPLILNAAARPEQRWERFGETWNNQLLLDSLLQEVNDKHPGLQWYQYKLQVLKLDQKVKFQEMLPKLDVNYQLLSKNGLTGFNPAYDGFSPNRNSYYGIKFQMPLRLSEGRASYQLAKLKYRDAVLDRSMKKIELENKVKKAVADFLFLEKQVSLQTNYVKNLELLANAEQVKLELGESSFFLTNSRDTKVVDAREKLIQLQVKRMMSLLSVPYSLGILTEVSLQN